MIFLYDSSEISALQRRPNSKCSTVIPIYDLTSTLQLRLPFYLGVEHVGICRETLHAIAFVDNIGGVWFRS
jgi:hypothetical protein